MYDIETLFEIILISISIILFVINVFGGFYLIRRLKDRKWHKYVGFSFIGSIIFGFYCLYSYFFLNSLYIGYSFAILIFCISIVGSEFMELVVLSDSLYYEENLRIANLASFYWIDLLIKILITLISRKKK